jgi:3-deoxy-D-manno-octulosonic-acid transferase
MKEFVRVIQPKWVVIIKYEFWFHFLNELNKKQIPVFLVSGIFRKEQIFFKPFIGRFFRKILSRFTHLFVQDENSASLLRSIGIEAVTVFGDTRYDRVQQNKAIPFRDPVIASCVQSEFVFIAGSVWKQDKDIVEAIVKLLPRYYQIIIAPHELEESEFWRQLFPEISAEYSSYKAQPKRILILDTIGLLSRTYRIAKFAYIGGGFGKGIHNILEASVYQIPVLIGPKYRKFKEAVELTERQVVFPVHSAEEAVSKVSEFLPPENPLAEIRQKLEEYFQEHANISSRIAVLIKEMTEGRT